jgi:hypothetical protein
MDSTSSKAPNGLIFSNNQNLVRDVKGLRPKGSEMTSSKLSLHSGVLKSSHNHKNQNKDQLLKRIQSTDFLQKNQLKNPDDFSALDPRALITPGHSKRVENFSSLNRPEKFQTNKNWKISSSSLVEIVPAKRNRISYSSIRRSGDGDQKLPPQSVELKEALDFILFEFHSLLGST